MRFYPILLLLLCASAAPALAGPREDSLAGISRCASLPDDRTFLDCAYGAMQPLRAALGLPPALAAQQRLVPPVDPSLSRSLPPPRAQAALPPPPGALPPPPAAPVPASNNSTLGSLFSGSGLHLVSYSFDRRGLFTITLNDGSVWKQDTNDTNFAHFSGKPANYTVALHQTDYGKTRMSIRGEDGTYVAERVR